MDDDLLKIKLKLKYYRNKSQLEWVGGGSWAFMNLSTKCESIFNEGSLYLDWVIPNFSSKSVFTQGDLQF